MRRALSRSNVVINCVGAAQETWNYKFEEVGGGGPCLGCTAHVVGLACARTVCTLGALEGGQNTWQPVRAGSAPHAASPHRYAAAAPQVHIEWPARLARLVKEAGQVERVIHLRWGPGGLHCLSTTTPWRVV